MSLPALLLPSTIPHIVSANQSSMLAKALRRRKAARDLLRLLRDYEGLDCRVVFPRDSSQG